MSTFLYSRTGTVILFIPHTTKESARLPDIIPGRNALYMIKSMIGMIRLSCGR